MGAWFGRPKSKPKPTAPQLSPAESAQLELRRTRDRISKFQKRLRDEHDAITEKAKAAKASGRTDQAVYFMKLRKIKQNQLDTISAQLLNLETLVTTIHSEAQNQIFLKALSSGNQVLKTLQSQLPLEEAQRIMEDSADAVAYQNEINNAFSTLVDGSDGQISEADLESELDSLTAAFDATGKLPQPSKAGASGAAALQPQSMQTDGQRATIDDLAAQLPMVPTTVPESTKVARESSNAGGVLLPA
jgi:charged multivesicular body protein 6